VDAGQTADKARAAGRSGHAALSSGKAAPEAPPCPDPAMEGGLLFFPGTDKDLASDDIRSRRLGGRIVPCFELACSP